MPRSIAEIRKANGGLANLTDEDILQRTFQTYKSYYPSLDAYAAEIGYGGAGRSLTGSRISAGIDQYQANLLGLGGAVARSVGAEDTAAAFDARRVANESAAAYAAQRARDLGGIEDWRDVTGVGTGLNFVGGLAAQSLPYLGEAVAGGLTGGLALGGTAARMGLTRAAASTAGAVGASYPSAVGDVLSAQREAGGENLGAAALGGIPYAALNALGIEGQLARGMRPLIQGEGGLARRLAVAVPTTAVAEGLSETGQEMINQYAGRMVIDPNETLFNEAANKRYLDSFVGGAALGGVFGGVGGLRSERPEQGAIDLTQPDTPAPLGKSITGTDPSALMGNPLAGANLLGGGYPVGLTAFGNAAQPTTPSLMSQETDLTAPAGAAATTPLAAETPAATTPAPSKLFSDDEQKLLSFGITPSNKTLAILPMILEAKLTEEQLDSVRTTLAQSKYKQAEKIIKQAAAQNIINAMSASAQGVTDGSTGISTVQQPAGGVGVGGAVVPGTVGTAGSNAPIIGGVGGSTAPAGATSGQTSVLPSTTGQPSTVVDQGPTTRGAPGTTALVDTSDDALEIARATGNAAEIEAMRQDQEGGRADQIDFGNNEMEAVIDQHLAKSKNKERDRKILQAYILARKSVPEGYKGSIAKEIADTFGVDASRVRQIGNPEILADIAESMGFDREQVFTHLGIDSATKAATTELGKLESDLAKLEAKASPSKADIAQMSALSEKIEQVKGNIESGDLTSALKEMGVEGEAGEMFASLDDSRDWQKASTAGSQMAVKLVGIADKIAELKAAAEELKQLGLAQAEAAATERINALAADYETLTANITAAKKEPKQTKTQKKTEAAQKAAEENDAAKEAAREAEAAKFRAERAAKLAADRKGLEVGDTVVNPKLGTGVVKGFSGDGDATIVTVDFKSGQTKELSVKMAKLEKTNAVQVQSTAVVPIQSEAQTGQGVGGQVRGAEKPAGQGQVTVVKTQGKKQVANKGQALWDSLTAKTPGLVPYEQLTKLEQDYLTDLAVRTNGKPVVAKEMGLQQLLTKEPVTIDVEARVIDETVAPKVAALPAPQVERLEKHYGLKRDSAEFLAKVKEDIVLYATKGAEAVAGAIRDIIKTLHSGVLAAAMIFNPTAVSKIESFVVIPQETQVTTQQVLAEVPAEAAMMSSAGKQAYATLIPALKDKLGNKFITIADKPSGRIFVFKADGSFVLQKKSLFGLAQGDLYKGNNDLPQNRITPAGLFGIKIIDAAKGGSAAVTAGDYDFGKVFALEDPDAVVTFMHSVWLKEKDAPQRAAALKSEAAGDSRYSFGCINVDKETYRDLITKYGDNMDGSKLFVVPDVQSTVNDFITGNVPDDRLVREKVQPVTKTVSTPVKSATQTAKVTRDVVGKEENMLFGKDAAAAPQPYTAKDLLAEIKDFVRADIPGRKLMVVDSVADLLTSADKNVRAVGAALQLQGAYGVAVDGRAFLVANRIRRGSGRAKFMHEVGGHLGLDNLLTKAQFDKLVDQIKNWARKADGSLESELALQAFERVQAAQTPKEDQRSELIAYFIESAMEMGVDPTAANDTKLSGPLRDWFRTLWAAFKIAVRKLGFKPETLTAQDVVNLAYGAARLEINGTWHGTAAAFRKFSHKFMGTGEGAQAYGWGTYLAERIGIAKGYWRADVKRKSRDSYQQSLTPYIDYTFASDIVNPENRTLEIYKGLELTKASLPAITRRLEQLGVDTVELADPNGKVITVQIGGPEGSLMRTDIGVSNDELLNWDKNLSHSSNSVLMQRIGERMSPQLVEDLETETGESLAEMRGEDFYRGLEFLEKRDGRISDEFKDVEDYNKRLANKPAKQIVSTYLDEVLGIPGLKFLDTMSRGNDVAAYTKRLEQEKRNLAELESNEYDHLNPDDTPMTPEQLASAISYTKASIEQFEKSIAELQAAPKTRNIVVFNDKNIFRVGSEAAANQQRMKFGGARFEGLPNKANPVLDEKVKAGNTNIDKAIRLLTRAAKEKDAATADALRAEAQKLFDSAASRMKFGKEVSAPTVGIIQRNIAKLPKAAQQPVRNSLGAMNDAMGKGLDYLVFTSDLVDRANKAGITSAKKFVDLIGKSKTEARENEIAVEKISDMYALVPDKDRGTGEGSVNRFLFDSTREGKWGYGKYRDETMGDRFDALSPESRAYVEAVFAHGSEVLAKKKKLVLDSTNSEYDAMIAAAKASGDAATEVKLTKEKEATLKRFQTLFKIRDGIPYAPIKRNGSHVVIAKSKEYLAAEAANDTKKITELESNGDHYHVSFTDGKWEARNLQQDLKDQGFFADVQIAERDSVIDEMFSGHSALRELTKMRSRVDEQAKAGDKSASKMLSLISQMYLEALAEGSARKSEMRRRGVDGEVDMIRSFAQQGRADAHFMASVKYNPQVQKALQEMRTQMKTGDRERKSEIFNELAKRYVQSMDYVERPWLNKLTRMSSLYYLATSPAYYLQNLTQPWMMSVPAMAGKHNYAQASGALFKAYTELGGVMKSAKLLKQQFDFAKVPADVRDAIKELVNRGKIDIGLDTEIGEFKVGGDSYVAQKINNADKALRLAVQKVESINRLSTAMAAYRLELAKTGNKEAAIDYADRILTETHGDYTSFNAPRAFNTGVGKVALQFRKFQLIQLAFYAKLIRDSLQGADRAAALKTLSYSLGHTALLAGAMGLPGYAAIAWAVGALFGSDDEPYDLTREIRKAIGDEQVANLILRGAPTLVGADISGKVGAGNMLSVQPFSQADLTTPSGQAEYFGTLIGGAALGMTTRMVDGLGLMLSGNWERGLEQTMPKGISDAMKAYRIANEGLTRRNGDIILPPSEISGMDTFFQAIGIQPVKQAVAYERQTDMKEMTGNFHDRMVKIKNDYVKAVREGNSEAQGKAREAWTNLQAAKQRNGVKSSPLSELMRAPAEQAKRERMTVGGVQYKANTRQLAEELAGE